MKINFDEKTKPTAQIIPAKLIKTINPTPGRKMSTELINWVCSSIRYSKVKDTTNASYNSIRKFKIFWSKI